MANGNGRQKLQIQATDFEIETRFKEGHPLSANEASAMNQLLAENIRNNMATTVRNFKLKVAGWSDEQIKAAKVEQMSPVVEATQLDEDQLQEIQDQIDEYVSGYEFGIRTGRARSPFDREVEAVTTEMLDRALKENGFSPSKFKKEDSAKYDALYTRVFDANRDEIEAAAQQRLDSMRSVTVKGLDIGALAKQENAAE